MALWTDDIRRSKRWEALQAMPDRFRREIVIRGFLHSENCDMLVDVTRKHGGPTPMLKALRTYAISRVGDSEEEIDGVEALARELLKNEMQRLLARAQQ
jgi:hypothetical protein